MEKAFIELCKVGYTYPSSVDGESKDPAIRNINLRIGRGEFIAVIGPNGSGKSTLSRLINALILPSEGTVLVDGMDTSSDEHLWDIRKQVGMVFQNPDNQIIATIVEEDVAFGPENLGFHPGEIRKRVDEALKTVNMYAYRKHAPHLLSGGQKQRVAIAGILAMKPKCIILDEATAMLDPIGRREVLGVIRKLHREEGITVLLITHHMDEAVLADRVLVVDRGRLALEGTPKEVFSKVEDLKRIGLEVPQVTQLIFELNQLGFHLPIDLLTVDEAFPFFAKLLEENKYNQLL